MQWGVEGREPGGFDDFFDWLNGKWGDGFAAWGPYITTTDSVRPDPNDLEMTLVVNDKTWQHGSTADMIFSPEEIIAFASRWMTLEPGDVIAGGTLDGTGDAAGVYLKAGDVMRGTVGDLGTLVTPVVAADGRG
jgi:2-keto-4-pentenoate hydratase/2-oxohepta-3-ene-1,7-dioic acid hydratase in catechol pathway